MTPFAMSMIRNAQRTPRHARFAAGLVATLLASCQFDVTAVPVERPPQVDGSTADDAMVRGDARDARQEQGGDANTAPWTASRGLPDAGPRDAQAWPEAAPPSDAADLDVRVFPPASRPDALADAAREAGALEAGPAMVAPEPSCPVARVSDAPSVPHALQLTQIERRDEPPFANRPLSAVAENGAHRIWLFGQAYQAAIPPQQSAEDNLALAAYDTSSAKDLTLTPRLPLEFTVSAGPILTRFADEPYRPGTLETVTFEVQSFVAHVDPQRGGEIFAIKRVGFESVGVLLADVAPGSGRATRRAAALFEKANRDYAYGAWRGEQYLTLYGCDYGSASCTVARAPNGSEDRADAYEVRTRDASGTWSWTPDRSAATPVISGVHADLTVSYNRYLRKYLAVHLEAQPLERTIVLQTAPAPEGPWTPYATVLVPDAPLSFIRHAREQPALADRCGKRVALSYFVPDSLLDAFPASGTSIISFLVLP